MDLVLYRPRFGKIMEVPYILLANTTPMVHGMTRISRCLNILRFPQQLFFDRER